jgi:hypothetical protein
MKNNLKSKRYLNRCLQAWSNYAFQKFKIFSLNKIIFLFFDVLILKINFKKYYFDIFLSEKYYKK